MDLKIKKLEDLLKGHIKGPIIEQNLSRLTAPGENFGSLMVKADIKVKNGEKEDTIHAVAKCLPPNKGMREIFNTDITFKNEIGWYTVVIPTALEFQRDQGVKNGADFFMNIYGARHGLDPNSEEIDDDGVILCENLALKGYGNVDRRVGFNLQESKEILKKLAEFHAIFLALRLKKPDVFEQKVKKYLHKLERKDDPMKTFRPVFQFLKEHPETTSLVPRVEKAMKEFKTSTKLREPWICAIHTDFWVNNIMIKEEDGKPPKVIILDLQVCGYGSPVDDLLFFLGTSLAPLIAERYFDELINLYYETLIENLKLLKVDPMLFPYESFQKELDLQGQYEYVHCMFFTPIIMAERGKAADTTSKEFNPQDEMKKMLSALTEKHQEKYLFLAKEFSKRNWI